METHGRSELDLSMCLEDALNQLPVNDIQLPWEQGVWKDIFKPQAAVILYRSSPDPSSMTLLIFRLQFQQKIPNVERRWSNWNQVGRTSLDPELMYIGRKSVNEAQMQVALKRWLEACLMMPVAVGLRQLLDQQVDVQSQLRLMRNLLWRKAPATLIKRANSLFRYLN